jgi:putative ABC transport system permease protein
MFKIALRNILRNKRRTALTGMSIMIAVMVAIYLWSLISGVVDGLFDNFIRLTSGHVRVLNSEYVKREKMMPLESNISGYKNVSKIIAANPEVTLTSPRIKFGVLLDNEGNNKPTMGMGIDPQKGEKVFSLSKQIIKGRAIVSGKEEINIGDKLAKELGLKVGETLTIVTQTAYGSIAAMNLKIVGIFRFGVPSFDGTIFFMPLDKAQELLDLEGAATEIFVLLKDQNRAPLIAKEIEEKLGSDYAAVPWQDQGIIFFYMNIAKYMYGTIYFIILFLASFTILNTMFMSVLERTKEIGMMKSLGMRDRQVMGVILIEAMLIGVFASFVGMLLGAGIAYYLATEGIDFTQLFESMGEFNMPLSYVYRAVFRWTIILFGFCMGVVFSVVASIPPALRASKMEPTEALREI